ncbi:MAG: hypothetical protein MUF01_14780 [Bryobacterales bacterium]|jgi:hypothetical protein|nr:hypothetical protein [Bryobacterales bacterium]
MSAHFTDPPDSAAGADFSRYRVLIAGEFSASVKHWAGLTELGVRVNLLGMASPAVRRKLSQLILEETLFVETIPALCEQAYARWTGFDLVVLVGACADAIEDHLRPWMEEAAASSLQPVLPLLRVDDAALKFLRTGEQWAFFVLGRTLGLGPRRAREFMEECCGHQKQDR